MYYISEQQTTWLYNYVNACLSMPVGTQIVPAAPCSATVAPDGEASTSTSCTARAQPATSESTKAAPDPADWPADCQMR